MRMGIGFVAAGDPAYSGEDSGYLPFCTDIVLPCGTVGPMNCDPSMGPVRTDCPAGTVSTGFGTSGQPTFLMPPGSTAVSTGTTAVPTWTILAMAGVALLLVASK